MHRSRVFALLVDAPRERAAEVADFWSAALGAPAHPAPGEPQFTRLEGAIPGLATIVQAVDDAPRYHLDIESDDVEAEAARLVALGAVPVARWLDCRVLEAPSGHLLCVVPVHSEPEFFAAHARTWD